MMNHITDKELQEYFDNIIPKDRAGIISEHLSVCKVCSGRGNSFSAFRTTFRTLPREKTSPDFTSRVIATIGIKESPSFAWRLLTNLAPFLLATILVILIAVVVTTTGNWHNTEYAHSIQSITNAYKSVQVDLPSASRTVNGWITKLFPFKFANDGLMLTSFLFCFFSAIGLMDKYVFPRLMKRQ